MRPSSPRGEWCLGSGSVCLWTRFLKPFWASAFLFVKWAGNVCQGRSVIVSGELRLTSVMSFLSLSGGGDSVSVGAEDVLEADGPQEA